MRTRTAIQRRDRPWVDSYVTVLVGPFEMPSVDELRWAVARLADRYPKSRLTWTIDPTGRYWRNDRTPESLVCERDWCDGEDLGSRLDDLARDQTLPTPLALIRYPNCIGIRMSHSVGDGHFFLTVISAVLRTAHSGDVVPWPVEPAGLFPLVRAASHTFGQKPSLVRSALDDRIPPVDHAMPMPAKTKPWAASRRTIHVSLRRGQADEIFDWATQFAPGSSHFALQAALVLKAAHEVGLPISSDVRVIVDLRRYLDWRYIDGNFVAGVPMRLNWEMTPEKLSKTIKATMLSGRPLANQILTALHGGAGPAAETAMDVDGQPRIAFTHLARSPEIECLPFLSDQPPIYAGSVPPEGPWGLTILLGENAQVMSFNATFHDNVVDAETVEEILRRVTADPIGLLAKSSAAC